MKCAHLVVTAADSSVQLQADQGVLARPWIARESAGLRHRHGSPNDCGQVRFAASHGPCPWSCSRTHTLPSPIICVGASDRAEVVPGLRRVFALSADDGGFVDLLSPTSTDFVYTKDRFNPQTALAPRATLRCERKLHSMAPPRCAPSEADRLGVCSIVNSTDTVGTMAVGDLDGDGTIEIVVPLFAENKVAVYTL